MTIIEGIGDDVLFLLTTLCAFIVVIISWMSTHVQNDYHETPPTSRRATIQSGVIVEHQQQSNNNDDLENSISQRISSQNNVHRRNENIIHDGILESLDEIATMEIEASDDVDVIVVDEDDNDDDEEEEELSPVESSEEESQVVEQENDEQQHSSKFSKNLLGDKKDASTSSSYSGNGSNTNNSISTAVPPPNDFKSTNDTQNDETEIANNVFNATTVISSQREGSTSHSEGEKSTTVTETLLADELISSTTNSDTSSSSLSNKDYIRVKVKYLSGTDRLIFAKPDESLDSFRRANFSADLSNNKLVRFIYNGHELRDDNRSLAAHGIVDQTAIHCLISENNNNTYQRNEGSTSSSHRTRGSTRRRRFMGDRAALNDDDELDDNGIEVGQFLLPLVAVFLGLCWYLRIHYRILFNSVSTFALISITLMFLVWFFTSLPTSPWQLLITRWTVENVATDTTAVANDNGERVSRSHMGQRSEPSNTRRRR